MKASDWQWVAFDKVPAGFLAEVALRGLYTFVLVFIFLGITGWRGMRQMSLFEMLIILTLGSTTGGMAFYDNVSLLPVLMVLIILALLHRSIIWLMRHSEELEDLLEGEPIVVVGERQSAQEKLHTENMAGFEFFMELRVDNVEQLGQARLAILETNGQISVFYYPDGEIRTGLSILPILRATCYITVPQEGIYACIYCGTVMAMQAEEKQVCSCRANTEWSGASRAKRLI